MFHYRRERKFLLHEFVVMADHFHLLLTPSQINLERALQLIKGGFSHRVGKDLGLNMEIWERGYVDHRIRDANDYLRHVAYIHRNPVEAKLGEDYLYCSGSPRFALDSVPRGLKPEPEKIA